MNAPKCPICNAPLASGQRTQPFPFCSQKCKLMDLSRWIDGDYVIAEPLAADPEALEALAELEDEYRG